MSKDSVNLISLSLILCLYLTYFYILNDLINKVESLSVRCFNLCLIAEINVALAVNMRVQKGTNSKTRLQKAADGKPAPAGEWSALAGRKPREGKSALVF